MPLLAPALALLLRKEFTKFNKTSTPSDVAKIYGDVIKEYIQKEAKIMYSWAAVSTSVPPVPDPILLFTTQFKSGGLDLLPPVSGGGKVILSLADQITVMLKSMPIETPSGFTITPLSLSLTGKLEWGPSNSIDIDINLLHLSTSIITGLNSNLRNLIPVIGTHGSFTGSGSMTAIL